jgi:cell division protein FtsW
MSTFARTDRSLISRWWWTVDKWTLGAVILLAAIGIVLIMAASPPVAKRVNLEPFHFVWRQAVYIPLGIAVMIATSMLSPKAVRTIALIVFVGAFLATFATLFLGAEVKGAKRWLWFAGLSVQPSEFLKPAFAVVAAWLISVSRINEGFIGYTLATAFLLMVCGVLALQPDIGTTLLVGGAWMMQVFLAGCPLVVFGLMGLLLAGGAVAAYFTFDHVRLRVDHFLDPASSEGYQVATALNAFRSGSLYGRGPGEGRVKESLPDAHADFIFAVVGEEFGLIVCILLIGLFAFIVLQGFIRALKDEDLFVVLAAGALLALFGAQALMNLGSTMHLIPPKGITLPFISYGGSATIALAWGMGMVMALTRARPAGGVRR